MTGRHPGPRLFAVAVGALVVLLAPSALGLRSVAAQAPTPAPAVPRRLVVLGDSVILGAKGPMTSALAGRGWDVVFDAAVSRSTLAGARALANHRAKLTDTLVVNLGANDAGSAPLFRNRVEQVIAAAGPVPNIYWLTIREVRPYYPAANQVLRDAAARHPNVRVLDWNAASTAPGLTARDGLHLTSTGAQTMTETVVAAVSTVPTTTAPPAAAPAATVATTVPPTTVPPTTVPPTTVPATTVPTTTVPTTAAADVPVLDRAAPTNDASGSPPAGDGWGSPARVGAGAAVVVALAVAVVVARRRRRRRGARNRARRIAAARAEHGVA